MSAIVVTGTDTGVGKTVVSAALAGAIGATYWKPVQAGIVDGTDSETVAAIGGVPAKNILPERWRFVSPTSPHLAAEREGIAIDPTTLVLPHVAGPLVVEGAGGVLVPIQRAPCFLMVDLFALWARPVLVVARSGLGTINHSLLTVEALRSRHVTVAGLVMVGDAHPDNEALIPALTGVPLFGRLPIVRSLDRGTLADAFRRHIDVAGITAAMR